jgi:hypothetical protein
VQLTPGCQRGVDVHVAKPVDPERNPSARMNSNCTWTLTPALREKLLFYVNRDDRPALMPTCEDELWAFIEQVAWPDPSPEFDGLMERVEDGVSRLRQGRTFEECVALWDTYVTLTTALQQARKRWAREGTPVTVPAGTYEHSLDAYAVQQGAAAYRSTLESPASASRLAARDGFKAHGVALMTLRDVFSRVIESATDAELEAWMARSAQRTMHLGEIVEKPFVHHPRFGYGLVQPSFGKVLSVFFEDGLRELQGAEATWIEEGEVFRTEARHVLVGTTSLSEARFWDVVRRLEWEKDGDEVRAGKVLGSMLSLTEQLAFSTRRVILHGRLEEHVRRWEERTGTHVRAGDDGLRDLVNHIIGLGREAYEATSTDPRLAAERAERRDYRESFAYVEQSAWAELPLDVIQRALRDHGGDSVVEDPVRGIGLRVDDRVVFPNS